MKAKKGTLGIIGGMAVAMAFLMSGPAAYADSYPLDTCPVSGGKLGAMGDPIVKQYDGREIRFCCAGCVPKFEANQKKYLEKVDAAIVKQQMPLYPLDTCIISGGKLGDMGKPIDLVYQNRLVRFCCKGCISTFESAPAKHLAKLDEAVMKKQKEAYPLETCIVSGDKLGGDMGEPIDYIIGNRLLRLCCKGCVKEVEKNPSKYLTMKKSDATAGAGHKQNGSGTK